MPAGLTYFVQSAGDAEKLDPERTSTPHLSQNIDRKLQDSS